MRNLFERFKRCPARSYAYLSGPDTRCARRSHHRGEHTDAAGRGWFNLSEMIRVEERKFRRDSRRGSHLH